MCNFLLFVRGKFLNAFSSAPTNQIGTPQLAHSKTPTNWPASIHHCRFMAPFFVQQHSSSLYHNDDRHANRLRFSCPVSNPLFRCNKLSIVVAFITTRNSRCFYCSVGGPGGEKVFTLLTGDDSS